MKSVAIAALSALLSSGALAVPSIHGHRHAGRHADHHIEKRDLVWVTEYEVETVVVYETVYADGATLVTSDAVATPSTTPAANAPAPTTVTSIAPLSTLQTSASPPPPPPPSSSPSSSTTTTTTTTSPAPAPTTTSPPYQPPAPTTSAYQAPAETTTSPAPASSSPPPSSGADTSNYQSGEVTFYDFTAGALGACGTGLDPTANTVAISEDIYGTYANPNDSPMCGKKLTIIGTDGTTYSATVADRCVACDPTHLDLTYGLFGSVTGSDYNAGVVQVKWSWD